MTTTVNELCEWLDTESKVAADDDCPIAAAHLKDAANHLRTMDARIAELETQTDAEPEWWTWSTPVRDGSWLAHASPNKPKPALNVTYFNLHPLYAHPPKQVNQWQPIETAPDNQGIDILIKSSDSPTYQRRATNVCRVNGKWYGVQPAAEKHGEYVTHWMPLPEPPIVNGVKP